MTTEIANGSSASPTSPSIEMEITSVRRSITTAGADLAIGASARSFNHTHLSSSPTLPGVTDNASPAANTGTLSRGATRIPSAPRYNIQRAYRRA